MTFFQSFRMSILAILSKKVRSFLTMLGTVIGVAAVIALVSVTEANNQQILDQMMQIGDNIINVYAYEWGMWGRVVEPGKSISDRLSKFISQELSEYTLGVTPRTWGGGRLMVGSKNLDVGRFFYVSEQYSYCFAKTIEKGRDLCYMDVQKANRVCVLGSYAADFLFGFTNPVGQNISINGENFTVVGVFAQTDFISPEPSWSEDNSIILPYTASRYIDKNIQHNDIYVKAKDAYSVEKAMSLLNGFLAEEIDENSGHYNVNSPNSYLKELEATNQSQTILLACIAAISMIVGGIGIMNIMLVTVTERTREIGIRKAIGAPRRSIITQFLIEASVLSFLGGLIGVIVGFLVTLFWGKLQYHIVATPNLTITAIAVAVSVLMGVGFGIYPAAKASRLQPVVALRNE